MLNTILLLILFIEDNAVVLTYSVTWEVGQDVIIIIVNFKFLYLPELIKLNSIWLVQYVKETEDLFY